MEKSRFSKHEKGPKIPQGKNKSKNRRVIQNRERFHRQFKEANILYGNGIKTYERT